MTASLSFMRQRGVAALLVTTLLALATILVVAYTQRNLVVEERASAQHVRSAQAFEAAQAGLEWALARLNDPARVGPDCRPSADAAARSARDLWIRFATAAGDVVPATWDVAGTALPLRAACVLGDGGWACSCPASGPTTLAEPARRSTAPAFEVAFAAGTRPGLIDIVATGCTRLGACASGAGAAHEAASRVEATFALLPALRAEPAAALTVRGDIDAGAGALGAHHRDGAGGSLAVHTGGHVAAPALRLGAPDGASPGDALASNDSALGALAGDRFFARFFAMPVAAWAAQPAVQVVACDGDCSAALAAAVAAGARLLFIDGDAALSGPASFGTADDPVVIVARGALTARGAITVHGVVSAASLQWRDAAVPGAEVHGAVLVAGDYTGDAAADFWHDGAVLGRLKTRAGSFLRINGSWKDF